MIQLKNFDLCNLYYFKVAEEEVATATVYLDLLLRSVTHPGLLQTFVKFVLCERFEKIKIIELLVNRINSKSFKVFHFHTIIGLNNVIKY